MGLISFIYDFYYLFPWSLFKEWFNACFEWLLLFVLEHLNLKTSMKMFNSTIVSVGNWPWFYPFSSKNRIIQPVSFPSIYFKIFRINLNFIFQISETISCFFCWLFREVLPNRSKISIVQRSWNLSDEFKKSLEKFIVAVFLEQL